MRLRVRNVLSSGKSNGMHQNNGESELETNNVRLARELTVGMPSARFVDLPTTKLEFSYSNYVPRNSNMKHAGQQYQRN